MMFEMSTFKNTVKGIFSVCNKCKDMKSFSTKIQKRHIQKGHLVIGCKRKEFDHYYKTEYSRLEEIPLASKGWTHNKSKGDYFTVYPVAQEPENTQPFKMLNVAPNLIEALSKNDIKKATEFQSRAIPTILSGDHTLLAAETGCGKTICYLIPIIQGLIGNKSTNLNTPKALILLPNRELAHQVGDVALSLCNDLGINVKVITGGRTKKLMMNPNFDQVDILIGTPGALGKLSTVGVYKFNEVQWTVLDEADTLIDDSFVDRMGTILRRVGLSQIVLVSATIPAKLPDVLHPIEKSLKHVVSPRIHKPLLNITQKFLRLSKSVKPAHLLEVTKNYQHPMLIFTNKNETCNWLAMFLRENGVKCSNINGDMNYAIRIEQWNQFVKGETHILSSTDIGSRGLNTINVKHVLNYDFPLYAADYIHRIGRVGRIGSPQDCKVTNFICSPREVGLVQQIEYAIKKNQPIQHVDGNITSIVQRNILQRIRSAA